MFGGMTDSPSLKILETAADVIDALGGSTAAARLAGGGARVNNSTNWRATGRLPARTFLTFRSRLAELGATAPASLWGIDEPQLSDSLAEGS